MYEIKPASKRAAAFRWEKSKNKKELTKIVGNRVFPFYDLKVGESFIMNFSECLPYDLYLVKEKANRYNRLYNVVFAVVKFEDHYEIVRIH